MDILLTNDDGIFAPGLLALVEALSGGHRVHIVAPESEQSAVGHAITLADPIRVKAMKRNGVFFGWALSGTPADCVRVGVSELLDVKPDMVISGINLGANVGLNVLYSGTVSAATEAAVMGLAAMAISLNTFADPDFTLAANLARRLVELWPELNLAAGVYLNVNVPAAVVGQPSGIAWARQLTVPFEEEFFRRIDPRNNTYYWRGREKAPSFVPPDTDYALLNQGCVTITPLRLDLTHSQEFSRLQQLTIDIKL